MKEKLIDIREILELLGYEDERSVIKWCKQNKIPVIKMGMKNYVLNDFIEKFIETELMLFINNNYNNPAEILDSIKNDDKPKLAKLLDAPINKKAEKEYKEEKKRSSIASDFLANIKKGA
jgi:hypothetical protein